MDNNEAVRPVEGVKIPPEIIADSKAKKKARRTLRQLPIYRDMIELKLMVAGMYNKAPKKMTKFIDSTLATVSEAKKCVGIAEVSRNAELRSEMLTIAYALTEDVFDDTAILCKVGIINKHTEKEMKSLAKGIVAQCVAWRDYTNTQGAIIDERI